MKFNYYIDASHGWVAVPRTLLCDLGILGDISSYSYQKGTTVYLEEDCDVQKFMIAYIKANNGQQPTLVEIYHNESGWLLSPIRNYKSFNCNKR